MLQERSQSRRFGTAGAYCTRSLPAGARFVEPALVVIGLSHRTAPIEVREHFWMNPERQREALAALSRSEGVEEAFVFSTCNRTEFVVWGDPTLAENSVLRFLAAKYDLRLCEWKNFYRLLDEQALAHAFRVSCGLDSMRVGEGQIGRQVNAAWQQAKRAGCTGPFLDAVLRQALAVRRRVRNEAASGFRPESAPQAAVDLADELFGSFASCSAVVVGAGTMGRAAAQELRSRGAKSVCVLDSRDEWAFDVSTRLGIQAAPFAERGQWLAAADLVISATSAAGFVVTADELKGLAAARAGRNQVIMDLALPRDVDPGARRIDGILLYDLDDLERSLKSSATVREAEADAEKVVLSEVQLFRRELTTQGTRTEISALQDRLDEICRQELESFRLEQGPLPKEQDQMIATVSSRITHRIAGSLARQLRTRL
jgi:glutamyl-tRNA reductase